MTQIILKPKLPTRTLLNRLITAGWCCNDCGKAMGEKLPDSGTTWHAGKCGICKKKTGVTEVRDFGYLKKGIAKYQEILDKDKRREKREKKKNSSSALREEADRLFSTFIRQRDADITGMVQCCTCPKKLHWKDMTCGHWISRKVLSTRYEESNCHPQEWGCQAKHLGNGEAHKHELYIIERHGKEERDRLLELSKVMQPDFDYKAIIAKYSNPNT